MVFLFDVGQLQLELYFQTGTLCLLNKHHKLPIAGANFWF
jgi:hypothetical protein